MFDRIVLFVSGVLFLFSLSGCANMRRQNDMEMQGLRNQVSVLESQLQSKDEEINSLKESLTKTTTLEKDTQSGTTVRRKRSVPEVKSRPNIRQIQTALSNAGFNPGSIDGRMGRQTREAIRQFQKANNLRPDGRVGKRTWAALRGYLYNKEKTLK